MLRLAPRDPDPAEFEAVPHACTVRPARCAECITFCPFGERFKRLQRAHDEEVRPWE